MHWWQSLPVAAKKAAAAGMAASKYLEMLINGEPPDDEPLPDDEDTELTAQEREICDRAEAFFKAEPARRGFTIRKPDKKPLKCHRKAISRVNRAGKESDSS